MAETIVRPGQVWGDSEDMRELTVQHTDARHAYLIADSGRKTKILLRRMVGAPRYYLKTESPARYVTVNSRSTCICGGAWQHHLSLGCIHCGNRCTKFNGKPYQVWTGDNVSPPHCTCEDFHWAERKAGELYLCKHLKFVLKGEEYL